MPLHFAKNTPSYIQENLHEEEEIIYIAHVHWVVYMSGLFYVIFGGLFGLLSPFIVAAYLGKAVSQQLLVPLSLASYGFIAIGIIYLLGAYLRRHYTEIAITNRRIIYKRGYISRESFEVLLERISGAHYDQTTMGRWWHYGTIHILASGASVPPIPDIMGPHYFTDLLTKIMEHRK